VRATHVAARVGQGVALLFGLVGLFGNPFLVFIALFVWMGAASEASMVQLKSALAGIPVSRVMITDFETLTPTDTLRRAIGHALDGFQQDFPVIDGGRVVGVLTRTDLMKGLTQQGVDATVASAMTAGLEVAEPSEMLDSAFQRLDAAGRVAAPVVRDGQLVGLLTVDNVGEFLTLQSALRRERSTRPAPAS
jgi:CBS domain-containing protein